MKKIPDKLTEADVHHVGGHTGNMGSRSNVSPTTPARAAVVARATQTGPDDERLEAAALGSEYKLRTMPKAVKP